MACRFRLEKCKSCFVNFKVWSVENALNQSDCRIHKLAISQQPLGQLGVSAC